MEEQEQGLVFSERLEAVMSETRKKEATLSEQLKQLSSQAWALHRHTLSTTLLCLSDRAKAQEDDLDLERQWRERAEAAFEKMRDAWPRPCVVEDVILLQPGTEEDG